MCLWGNDHFENEAAKTTPDVSDGRLYQALLYVSMHTCTDYEWGGKPSDENDHSLEIIY